jgi:hypothetical protein
MEEKEINPQESLQLINNMIHAAKNKLADDGFHLIFWGWLVFGSAMLHYCTIMLNIPYGYLVWPILMPLGGIISGIYGYKQVKKDKVKTYVDVYLTYLWGAFAIGMTITLVFMPWHGIDKTYFFLMILYGLATFVSGGLLNFKPLIIGSLFSFACAAFSVFIGETAEQLVIISVALLLSYIIPGHLLRAKYKSQNV